jgi:hypothetical protein
MMMMLLLLWLALRAACQVVNAPHAPRASVPLCLAPVQLAMDTHQANVELQEAALATLLNVCLAPACRGDVFKGGIPVLYNVMDLHIAQQRIQVCCREGSGPPPNVCCDRLPTHCPML